MTALPHDIRFDWTVEDVTVLLNLPILDLIYQAQTLHRRYNPANQVQLATLLSVKTGGCGEDCGYCSQSAHHPTAVKAQPILGVDQVLSKAREAKSLGATRFCMGWAWREIREGKPFQDMLEMVRAVKDLDLEVCVTAGMLTPDQAQQLAEAGLTAYNHNLDTSPEYYPQIISTRTYEERLRTLEHVRDAGLQICCGGIIGLGESVLDRAHLLQILATMNPHPESVPINALVPIEGTPLDAQPQVDAIELVRMCAVARILMPRSKVRLSAGRTSLSREAQLLCFTAGANSIFYGDKLLTTDNPDQNQDRQFLEEMGLNPLPAFAEMPH